MKLLDRLRNRPTAIERKLTQAMQQNRLLYLQQSSAAMRKSADKYLNPTPRTFDPSLRRAIAHVTVWSDHLGLVREGFDKAENDRLAMHAVYAICEKAIMDYFGTVEWEVIDEEGKKVRQAETFLKRPNEQESLNTLFKQSCRDLVRYDAAVWVKTKNLGGELVELKCHLGTDFWPEMDRSIHAVPDGSGIEFQGQWSAGYIRRWWQRSYPGIIIPFAPDEICYMHMYPTSDSPYGTDFLSRLTWQLEYLLDSTKAAGMTFANGVMPGIVWNHPDIATREQLEERLIEVETENKGPVNMNGMLHTIGEEEITTLTPTMVDMQWLEGQRYVDELIWAMFGFTASEFTSNDVNRATAYVHRNITKSRALNPILRYYENVINMSVLPDLPGYREDWKFRFIEAVDLDDELKQAQILQTRAAVAQNFAMLGIDIIAALKAAEVDDDKIEFIKQAIDTENNDNSFNGDIAGDTPPDAYVEDYDGTDLVDQAMSGAMEKAERIYLKPGEKPPEGAKVQRGDRGGLYYEARAAAGKKTSRVNTKNEREKEENKTWKKMSDLQTMVRPQSIVTWNEATDEEKVESLKDSMTKYGWVGRPIVMIEGSNQALTGSHRIQAAIEAEIEEIPTIIITDDMLSEEQWDEFHDCHRTDDLVDWLEEANVKKYPELEAALKLLKYEADNES